MNNVALVLVAAHALKLDCVVNEKKIERKAGKNTRRVVLLYTVEL